MGEKYIKIYFILILFLFYYIKLFERVKNYNHYDEKKAADNFRPVVDAIRYCHEMGIAHRDLKVN